MYTRLFDCGILKESVEFAVIRSEFSEHLGYSRKYWFIIFIFENEEIISIF